MADIYDDLTKSLFLEREDEKKHPAFEGEMGLYTLIAEGKKDRIADYLKGKPESDAKERGVLSQDPLRNTMYHFVAMTTMVTRVCISKGLEQSVAYKMSDTYISRADRLTKPEEVKKLQGEMMMGFAETMARGQKRDVHSKQIVRCIDYIGQHLHEKISMEELSGYVNLNETYLSKLFRKEMGCSVTVEVSDGYPTVYNPPDLFDRVAESGVDFQVLEEPVMIAEDFSWYQRHLPGMFFFLGTGPSPALHSADFHFDENILQTGADFWKTLAAQYKGGTHP